tara:strand:+ start:471 stop:872 length:402 start_codon:yes stop_codon:yes gene_type:complete
MTKKFDAAGLLLKFGQSVLLGRRSSICANLSGYWSMPCGMTEEAENPIDTAKREFFEETGSVAEGDVKFLNSFPMDNGGEFTLFFVESSSLVFPSSKALDAIEHEEWGYFRISKESLPYPITKETKKSILMLK